MANFIGGLILGALGGGFISLMLMALLVASSEVDKVEKCKNSEDLCFKSVETKAKTCKDCLYYDKLCFYALLPSELNLCKDFLDKANVIEVVRCKNCVYANENGDVCYFGTFWVEYGLALEHSNMVNISCLRLCTL